MATRARRLRRIAVGVAILVCGALALDRLFPPDLTRWANLSNVVLAADGTVLNVATTKDGMWRLATRPGTVDPHYVAMLMAAEDHRFHDHLGVDPLAALRAAWQLATNGRIVSGGSTLTMQVARLLEPHKRSVLGKLHDAVRAVQLERRFDKDEILAMYLTLAPFGGNVEGVRAASLAWFGHEPDRLTPGEAAILVALPQRPTALRPDRHPQASNAAAARILHRLADAGRIPPADLETPPPTIVARRAFPRFAEHVAHRFAGNGAQPVRTTLDARIQTATERLAAEVAGRMTDGGDLAILVIDNRDLSVRAWVGGVRSALDLVRRRRSPGSTLKPFIYGLAFDDLALLPDSLIEDRPIRIGDYAPENFDRGFHGQVTARFALQQSLNVPAIVLLDRVGPGRMAATLRDAGARLSFPNAEAAPTLPLALGGVGVSLLDLTRLYAALAHDGRSAAPHILETPSHGAGTLMTQRAARMLTDILRGSPPPDGRVATGVIREPRPIAYKTGTSYGFRDAWAVGYSPSWTVGVWSGRADGTPRPGYYGRNMAAPVLYAVFDRLPAETEPDPLAPTADGLNSAVSAPVPLGLRRFAERDSSRMPGNAVPPRIQFPPDGSQLDLLRDDGQRGPLRLEANSGTPPYHWSVNGVPVPAPRWAGIPSWQPDGPGFARVTVVDAAGRRASASVRIR